MRWLGLRSQPVADQLVLERRNPPADVRTRDRLDEERPLSDAKAVHFPLGLVLLTQQQPQLPFAVQVDVRPGGVLGGLDADGEAGGGGRQGVGSQVYDDGSGGVEPLQKALWAAQIHLLHVPGVAFVGQPATGGRKVNRELWFKWGFGKTVVVCFFIWTHLLPGVNGAKKTLHPDCKDTTHHSFWSTKAVRKTGCMTSHEPKQSTWPQLKHTPYTTLFCPELWQKAPLAGCLWEEFGADEWRGHRGFWGDNSSSNSSWACCMQVQMPVTHQTSPLVSTTDKESGRDLPGQRFGLWRQHDQIAPSTT